MTVQRILVGVLFVWLLPMLAVAQNTLSVNFDTPVSLSANAGRDTNIGLGENVAIGGNPSVKGNLGVPVYEWSPAQGLSDASVANPLASPAVTTTYTLKVTDVTGCSVTDQVVVAVSSSSIETVASAARKPLVVYPNPNKGKFQVDIGSRLLASRIAVCIVNVVGDVLYSETVAQGSGLLQIDVSFLPEGMYLVRLGGIGLNESSRFVIY